MPDLPASAWQDPRTSAQHPLKVNLLVNDPDGVIPGWLNIDLLGQPGRDDILINNIWDLVHTVDINEAAEVRAIDILQYVPQAGVKTILQNWASRLARGGLLTVRTVDFLEVVHGVSVGLSLDRAQTLLYGQQRAHWDHFQSAHTMESLTSLFQSCGLTIDRAVHEDYRALVIGRRP